VFGSISLDALRTAGIIGNLAAWTIRGYYAGTEDLTVEFNSGRSTWSTGGGCTGGGVFDIRSKYVMGGGYELRISDQLELLWIPTCGG